MSSKESIKDKLRKYLMEESVSKDVEIRDDTLIFDAGILDSMGLLFLIEFLNEEYQIIVNDQELLPENFESINNISAFVNQKLS
jgi:acyl carrier protein